MHPIIRHHCPRTATHIRLPCTSRILDRPPTTLTRRLMSDLGGLPISRYPIPRKRQWTKHFPGRTLHEQWYTDACIPFPWSTCWEEWEGLRLFYETVDGGTPKIDKLFKYTFEVPGVVHPLAYIVENSFDTFFFTAQGRYYLYDDCRLWVSDEKFGSYSEFLERTLHPDGRFPAVVVKNRPGSRLDWLGYE